MEAIREGRASGKQRLTIGEVNDRMPVVFGDNWLHVSEFDAFFENPQPIPELGRPVPGERDRKIGEYVMELIKDGDTIQMGIGSIPEAVVARMEGKHDIGIHTEMFPIGLPQLVEKGIVNNEANLFTRGSPWRLSARETAACMNLSARIPFARCIRQHTPTTRFSSRNSQIWWRSTWR